MLFSSHYLPALARPNVELVTEPIARGHRDRPADRRRPAARRRLHHLGHRLHGVATSWRRCGCSAPAAPSWPTPGARAPTPTWAWPSRGFPSLFFLYGPNTNTSGGSIIVYLEAQAAYIRQALERLRAGGHRRVEVRADVEAASDRELQARFAGTAWTACDSWYRDENGRIVANWPGYMREYVEATRTLDPHSSTFQS